MDSSTFTSYGAVTDINYSPNNQVFTYPTAVDDSRLAEPCTMSPDNSIAGFFDCDSYFTHPLASPRDHIPSKTTMSPATTKRTAYASLKSPPSPTFNPTPLGQLEPFESELSFWTSLSPYSQHSQSPSVYKDVPRELHTPCSAELSQLSVLECEPTDKDTNVITEPSPPSRKRSRPRLSQYITPTSTTPPIPPSTKTRRLPHNQVERKYRENLNAALERLRCVIPTLAQKNADSCGVMAQPKPSKAMVLASAIEYIKTIERERNEYREECERLRGLLG